MEKIIPLKLLLEQGDLHSSVILGFDLNDSIIGYKQDQYHCFDIVFWKMIQIQKVKETISRIKNVGARRITSNTNNNIERVENMLRDRSVRLSDLFPLHLFTLSLPVSSESLSSDMDINDADIMDSSTRNSTKVSIITTSDSKMLMISKQPFSNLDAAAKHECETFIVSTDEALSNNKPSINSIRITHSEILQKNQIYASSTSKSYTIAIDKDICSLMLLRIRLKDTSSDKDAYAFGFTQHNSWWVQESLECIDFVECSLKISDISLCDAMAQGHHDGEIEITSMGRVEVESLLVDVFIKDFRYMIVNNIARIRKGNENEMECVLVNDYYLSVASIYSDDQIELVLVVDISRVPQKVYSENQNEHDNVEFQHQIKFINSIVAMNIVLSLTDGQYYLLQRLQLASSSTKQITCKKACKQIITRHATPSKTLSTMEIKDLSCSSTMNRFGVLTRNVNPNQSKVFYNTLIKANIDHVVMNNQAFLDQKPLDKIQHPIKHLSIQATP